MSDHDCDMSYLLPLLGMLHLVSSTYMLHTAHAGTDCQTRHLLVAPMMNTVFLEFMPSISVSS